MIQLFINSICLFIIYVVYLIYYKCIIMLYFFNNVQLILMHDVALAWNSFLEKWPDGSRILEITPPYRKCGKSGLRFSDRSNRTQRRYIQSSKLCSPDANQQR